MRMTPLSGYKFMAGLIASLLLLTTLSAEASDKTTRYMLEGVATPEVFAGLIKQPEDRSENARGLMAKAGCELISYYIGVNNYKSYVIIECGPDVDIAALQFVTFAAGGITEGTASQIITSAEAAKVAERAGELAGSYKIPE